MKITLSRDSAPAHARHPALAGLDRDAAWSGDRDVERFFTEGTRRVEVAEPIVFEDEPGVTQARHEIDWIQFLQDAASHRLVVEWTLDWRREPRDLDALVHLPPPRELGTDSSDALAPSVSAWRRRHHYGMLFDRRGPSFRQVKDRRFGAVNAFLIDDSDWLDALDIAAGGSSADTVLPLLGPAMEERLLMSFGPLVVWLPYRLRRAAIPAVLL